MLFLEARQNKISWNTQLYEHNKTGLNIRCDKASKGHVFGENTVQEEHMTPSFLS